MLRRLWCCVLMLTATSAVAQQTIYWKKDHIYVGGSEIATLMPAPLDQAAPTVPSGLSSSELTSTSVRLQWGASTDTGGSGLAGYKIYRGQVVAGTVGAGALSFTDPHLRASTAYTYTVAAFDNAQNRSSLSNAVTFTTIADNTPPATPGSFRMSYTGATSTRLQWATATETGGAGLAGYRVYREGALISGTSPITQTYFDDTTLAANTGYSYTVTAVDYANNTSPAAPARSVFRDDFTRGNSAGMGTSNWSSSGNWNVTSNFASMSVNNDTWSDAWTSKSFGSFQADARIRSQQVGHWAGVTFWGDAGTQLYRAYMKEGVLYLSYYSSQGGEAVLGSYWAGVLGPWTVRIETDMNTRTIKVYREGTLRITYTETNTSRPNSGKFGFSGYVASSSWLAVEMDDLVIEETNGFAGAGDTTAPSTPAGAQAGYLTTTTAHIDWTAAADTGGSGLAGYYAYRDGVLISGNDPNPNTFFQDVALATNSAYTYTIKAADNDGNLSGFSGGASLFRDNFNRANGGGLSNSAWSEYGLFQISGTEASYINSELDWSHALTAKTFGTFRAVVNVTQLPWSAYGGLIFWSQGAAYYRVYAVNNYVYLDGPGFYREASVSSGPCNLRVEANSATRNIKVYRNDVLVINYTETNTNNPNSGKAGIVGRTGPGIYTPVKLDDFIVEER